MAIASDRFSRTMNAPPNASPARVQPLWFCGKVSVQAVASAARGNKYRSPKILSNVNPNQAFADTNRKRAAAKRPSRQPRANTTFNPAVLVVDDVADVTDMIALFLRHAGYDVTTANSAATALSLAAAQQFDLVISDIGMPEMNGYQLAESLRGQADYRQTPLIAVTGYTEYDDRGRSIEAGFDAHLTKPINPSHLLDVIRQLLRSS